MKTKINLFGMCFDWRVLTGLAVVGVGIAVLAPKLTLSILPLLLLAACPLSMLLMMTSMSNMDRSSTRKQLQGTTVNTALSREEQLTQLREQLQYLQSQQETIASQVNELEQAEWRSPADGARPGTERHIY